MKYIIYIQDDVQLKVIFKQLNRYIDDLKQHTRYCRVALKYMLIIKET